MARICDITGKRTESGHNVSHSMRHTKRTFKPNLQEKTYYSPILGRNVSLRLSARAIRTLDRYNGLDGFMLQVKNRRVIEDFSPVAAKLRAQIVKKGAATVAAKPAKAAKAKAPKAAAKAKAAPKAPKAKKEASAE